MSGRTYRSATLSPAVRWLCDHGCYEVADALARSGVRVRRLGSAPAVHLTVVRVADLAILQAATNCPIGPDDLPGPLDRAFEAALPGGAWPVFTFEVAARPSCE